ncbi:hypothetical protein ACFQBQ_02010 [Granulicella cerasi]|uniref:Uncharacterized protein n=1 Tax=Granulicella cerasi TaxID=741063 RepID=A0ABW1Z5X6_9BACT
MRIAQAVFGVFHHFDLARELDRRGHLQRIYSTWPWRRLQREGLAHDKVATYPYFHTLQFALGRVPGLSPYLDDWFQPIVAPTFDRWQIRQFERQLRRGEPLPEALISIAGASHYAGLWLQQHGGKFICDRGSSHHRFQMELVSDEFRRWGAPQEPVDIRNVVREEEIYAVADAISVPSSFAAQTYVDMGIPRRSCTASRTASIWNASNRQPLLRARNSTSSTQARLASAKASHTSSKPFRNFPILIRN